MNEVFVLISYAKGLVQAWQILQISSYCRLDEESVFRDEIEYCELF